MNTSRKHIQRLRDYLGVMNDREREFVSGLAEAFEKYGDRTAVSPNQLFWLRDLSEKY